MEGEKDVDLLSTVIYTGNKNSVQHSNTALQIVPEELVNLVCRTCLTTSTSVQSIFKANFDQMIMECTSVKIFQGDGFPSQICLNCIAQLTQAYSFKQQVENCGNTLSRFYVHKEMIDVKDSMDDCLEEPMIEFADNRFNIEIIKEEVKEEMESVDCSINSEENENPFETEDNLISQSDKLPKVHYRMVTEFLTQRSELSIEEIHRIRVQCEEWENYGVAAVGYVQLRRSRGTCSIRCKICPKHKVCDENYSALMLVDEAKEKIIKVKCLDCPASRDGCKHAVTFIMWAHRQSEKPVPTEVECYWKKSNLAQIRTSQKYITTKDFGSAQFRQLSITANSSGFLEEFIKKGHEAKISARLMTYYQAGIQSLGLHQILCNFAMQGGRTYDEFMTFAAARMTCDACEEAFHATMDQTKCNLWYDLKYARITASKVYEIACCKSASSVLVEDVIGGLKIKEASKIKKKMVLEKKVLLVLEDELSIKLKHSGIILSPEYPNIGVTPDAICDDFVVEIKCPTSDTTVTSYLTKDNEIADKYRAQIMLQMLMLHKTKGVFCVADPKFEQNKKINVVTVDLDKNFIENIVDRALSFWKDNIFDVLISEIK